MSESYVTTGAAAKAVGVSSTTLQRWAHAGFVQPAVRTAGGHFRWDLDSLRTQLRVLGAGESGAMTEPATEPEPQPVVAAIVTSELGVLIARRNDGNPPWTFPAGEIEPGESPADAAVREVKEETGCQIAARGLIGRRVHPKSGRTMIYMAALPVHGTDVHVGDADELAEVRWASLGEVDELLPGMYEPVRAYLLGALGPPGRA